MTSASNRWAIFLVVATAALLRVTGIGFAPYHPDEHLVIHHALAFGGGDLNPHMFYYPTFFLYQLFAVFGAYFALGSAAHWFSGADDFLRKFLTDPLPVYVLGRLVSATYGVLTVWLIARTGKVFSSARAGLFSAALLAVSFLHVRDSHFATVDIALTFYMLWTVHGCLKSMELSSERALLTAAFIAGLATGIKYNAFLLALPIAVSAFLTFRPRRLPVLALAAAGLMALGFFVSSPFVLLDWGNASRSLLHLKKVNLGFAVPWDLHARILGDAMDWAWLLAAVAGLAIASTWKKRLVLLSLLAPYYVMITRVGQPFERYVLPMVPLCLLLAASAIDRGLLELKAPAARKALWAALAAFFLLSAAKTVHSDMLFLKEDTRQMAKRWIEANVPDGTAIALDVSMYSPKLNAHSSQLDEKLAAAGGGMKARKLEALRAAALGPSYRLYYLNESPDHREFTMDGPYIPYEVMAFTDKGIRYFVTSDVMVAQRPHFYSLMKGRWRLVASFEPLRAIDPSAKPEPRTYLPIDGSLWNYGRPGPKVYVYQREEGA